MTTLSPSNNNPRSCHGVRLLLDKAHEPVGVYHWDADGMASAALVLRTLSPHLRLEPPPIASFSPHYVLRHVEEGVETLSLDYGISLPSQPPASTGIEEPPHILGVVDHHRTQYPGWLKTVCNPVALEGAGEDDYPSTTWVLWRRILQEKGGEMEVGLVALGILGDLGARAGDNTVGKWALEVLSREGLDAGEALELVALADSCYKTLDRECVKRTTQLLAGEGPLALRGEEDLVWRRELVEEEIKAFAQRPPHELVEKGGLKLGVWRHESNFYTTSSLGRMLAQSTGLDAIVLVHRVPGLGKWFVYTRSKRHPIGAWLINSLRSQGYNVGGKDSVAVVECNGEDCASRALETILRILEDLKV